MARIVVGVGGGIAAFKVAALVSRLAQHGHNVKVVLTASASRFVGQATFAALSNHEPVTELFDPRYPLGSHIALAEDADLLVVAPATARLLASCALGLADDLLATLYLQVECPVVMAPAMSHSMWNKPAVQRNVARLTEDGVNWVGPESGWLSCRKTGIGRMAESDAILQAIESLL